MTTPITTTVVRNAVKPPVEQKPGTPMHVYARPCAPNPPQCLVAKKQLLYSAHASI
jgi:hypothetical protein